MNEPETIETILQNTKTIAVIGLSDNPERPSYGVAKYMQEHGYRIVPINPQVTRPILGEEPYPSLDSACSSARSTWSTSFARRFCSRNRERCNAAEDPLPVAAGRRLP